VSGLDFADLFREIAGHEPRDYQVRLAERLAQGEPPSHLSVPTGMGKTLAVLIGWLYALAQDAEQVSRRRRRLLPTRRAYRAWTGPSPGSLSLSNHHHHCPLRCRRPWPGRLSE